MALFTNLFTTCSPPSSPYSRHSALPSHPLFQLKNSTSQLGQLTHCVGTQAREWAETRIAKRR